MRLSTGEPTFRQSPPEMALDERARATGRRARGGHQPAVPLDDDEV